MVPLMRPRWSSLLSGLAIALATGPAGVARAADATLRIACPDLGSGDRAALEARVRAELSGDPSFDGDVAIECGARSAVVRLRVGAHHAVERRLEGTFNEGASVDELLNALHAMVAEATRPEPAPAAPVASVPPPPAVASPEDSAASSAAPPASSRYRLAVAIGVDSELWSGAIGPALGGHAGARLSARAGWGVEIDGGLVQGLGSVQGVSARTFRAMVNVDRALVPDLRIGLGADARLLTASASNTALQEATTMGAVAFARYSPRVGRYEFSVGPEVEILVRPVVVQSSAGEAFRLPTWIAGLSVGAAAAFGE